MPFDWDENQQPRKSTFMDYVYSIAIALGFASVCLIFGYAMGK